MALRKGSKINRGYATVASDEGVNYREIADTMTELGFPMNHSSARNYVLRIMRKFAEAFATEWDELNEETRVEQVTKDPNFQQGVAELLHVIEARSRRERSVRT